MASLSFTHFLPLSRYRSIWQPCTASASASPKFVKLLSFGVESRNWSVAARKKLVEGVGDEALGGDEAVAPKKKRAVGKRTKKKAAAETSEDEGSDLEVGNDAESKTVTKKAPRATRKKAVSVSSSAEEVKTEKKVRGRKKSAKKEADVEDLVSEIVVSPVSMEGEEVKTEKKARGRKKTKQKEAETEDLLSESEVTEESPFLTKVDDENEEELNIEEGEDISSTYGWPPLVCCFGAAQHAFVPSGRKANRLVDYEIRERYKDAYWSPQEFVRSPGGSAGSVAIALASLGGKVAFMGKLGTDDYGEAMLYYMNVNSVQTRSVRIDARRQTAISQMKISKRGRFRTTCVKPCAEDSLLKSEINIDVLKEAKMFYFNSQSLLDPNMRQTALQAIKISKKLGGVVFFDVNLPMPLWLSSDEAKAFVSQVWNLADIIEVTKQELEFFCGITPPEEFDTEDNARSKFTHYEPDVIAPLWHENLKVMFVTNGTSKIHYYTKEHNGSVLGMEEPPLTPFTGDMSASGDGIIAGLMRLLTVQPDLITDKDYLEHTIRFAINCGVIDQWALGRVRGFPPNEEDPDEVTPSKNGIMSITETEYRTLKPVS